MSSSVIKPWEEWLDDIVATSTMRIEQIDIDSDQMGPWKIRVCEETGFKVLSHDPDKHFKVKGVLVYASEDANPYPRPMFEEVPKGGFVVVPMNARGDRFLIAARKEPGNGSHPGRVLLGAACQMSIPTRDSDPPPPRKGWIDGATFFDQSDDGDRWEEKDLKVGYIVVDENTEPLPGERWFTRDELREASRAGKINQHLADALFHAFV